MKSGNRALASAAVLVGLLSAGGAIAADFGPPPPLPPPPVQPVYEMVNPYCMAWSVRCDRRWGVGSPRFFRCMWRHGC
jgi:hypothetical protein